MLLENLLRSGLENVRAFFLIKERTRTANLMLFVLVEKCMKINVCGCVHGSVRAMSMHVHRVLVSSLPYL